MKTLIRMAAFAAACCAMQAQAQRAVVREQPEGTVLVVGHSDTLPGLLKALGHAGDVKIEPTDYGNVFVWTQGNGGKPLTMRY